MPSSGTLLALLGDNPVTLTFYALRLLIFSLSRKREIFSVNSAVSVKPYDYNINRHCYCVEAVIIPLLI